MKKVVFLVVLMVLLVSTVSAIYDITYFGYSGQSARERRKYDPYSREMYFGEGYVNPFGGFGMKGPVQTDFGKKSAYSATHNLPYDEFSSMSRNPQSMQFSPQMQGFARQDAVVELMPANFQTLQKTYPTITKNSLPQGTARVLSLSNNLRVGLTNHYPQGKVYMHVLNMPNLAEDEIYEVWLVDEETGYPMTMGLMYTSLVGTAYHAFEIYFPLTDFDYVIVTREPAYDTNPWPGEIILKGNIEKARVANPIII